MTELPADLKSPLVELLLSVADDKLMLGQRNADWTGLAPILEEDIAFSSLAQDDLAHALALFEFIAGLTGGRADAIAYGRAVDAYRCSALVEQQDGFDWSVAIVRQFLCDHFEQLRLTRLSQSVYEPLRHLAVRLLAEERLAIGHADQWVVRLGRAGDPACTRMQTALDRTAPLATSLFEPTEGVEKLERAGVFPPLGGDMFDLWREAVEGVAASAMLRLTAQRPDPGVRGGRRGVHSAEFAPLHAEMTEVYRVEPNAAW